MTNEDNKWIDNPHDAIYSKAINDNIQYMLEYINEEVFSRIIYIKEKLVYKVKGEVIDSFDLGKIGTPNDSVLYTINSYSGSRELVSIMYKDHCIISKEFKDYKIFALKNNYFIVYDYTNCLKKATIYYFNKENLEVSIFGNIQYSHSIQSIDVEYDLYIKNISYLKDGVNGIFSISEGKEYSIKWKEGEKEVYGSIIELKGFSPNRKFYYGVLDVYDGRKLLVRMEKDESTQSITLSKNFFKGTPLYASSMYFYGEIDLGIYGMDKNNRVIWDFNLSYDME